MGTLLRSTRCHYCGEHATTVDHIVPRADLPKPLARLPYWFKDLDEVPACTRCNNDKGRMRSDCACRQCNSAWGCALARFLPKDYVMPEYVCVVRNRPADEVAG